MKTILPFARRSAGRSACVTAHLPDEIDLELVAELVDRDELERRAEGDPRVVDEPVQLVDALRGTADLLGVGDVEEQLLGSLRRVTLAANAGEHAPPCACKPRGARLSDPRRRAGDDGRAGQSSSQEAIRARCTRPWPPYAWIQSARL